MKKSLFGMLLLSVVASGFAQAASLNVQAYNASQHGGIFPVSSELVSGKHDAILFDAQFDTKNGQNLVDMIKKSGKKLTAIYISGGDPDYYFGLEPIVAAFPDVKIMASQHVVDHIKATKDAKLAYWGPILGDGAPEKVFVPQVMDSDKIMLEGQAIEVKALDTDDAFLWAPSVKTAFGGVAVSYGLHVWMADSQTKAARQHRIDTMNAMIALQPERVIPGHFVGSEPEGSKAAVFTRDYIQRFESELAKAKNSGQLIEAMKKAYPEFPAGGLDIGAKVATGEMKW
ncbi:MBL fold metallo-hydrolase [Vibrio mangrovi]|uniref:MBL fold metallo-hydrolase n=1 Tax=Vibrio mangrovi TaxID=474394 RepID=A0A1Y6IW94_9VIBR|nr:MBL fold metallo-hydrolase [Vibrio mangrovi]MDW6002533.1 MBL fold metallo-hydrolase [Vibrio mangrovi]SMS01934.1 Metallo-beta-lactamase superfamily protein [Vibrio mangrovi]